MSVVAVFVVAAACRADGGNLVSNGSFEEGRADVGGPVGWTTSGNPAVHQRLTLDSGRDGGRCARLVCTAFGGDGPDFHAMICQLGRVGVRRGTWYKLSFWAKAAEIKAGGVDIALVNTKGWVPSGLDQGFTPGARWEWFEFLFQCRRDVPAPTSRLQIWFRSTGTLWLDDVSLVETSEKPRWYPQIGSDDVANAVPNSSFECGTAGWGSLTWGLGGWEGNLFRLEGECDASQATHGRQCLKIALDSATAPICWFDYYQPVRDPVTRVLAANRGWIKVKPGEPLTLSAFLRADSEGAVAQLAVSEVQDRLEHRQVRVGKEWKRYTFTFVPSQPYLFVAVGLDLAATKRQRAVLWVDALQLERGEQATDYHPRSAVESFVESGTAGFVSDARQGASLTLRAYNDDRTGRTVTGRIDVTDAFAKTVAALPVKLAVAAHSGVSQNFKNVAAGRLGAFRARWRPEPGSGFVEPGPKRNEDVATLSTTRLAVIEPLTDAPPKRAPFGFNHAYPWDFLVERAQRAGVVWWRDWSAKWNTVEPRRGTFDWHVADAQIGRVLDLGGNVEILLPFPSAGWSTSARSEAVAREAGGDGYLRARLPMAYAPQNLDDFGHYAGEAVRHYRWFKRPSSGQEKAPPFYVQVLNEPVYTDYALPQKFGYSVDDYVNLLHLAHDAMKQADPNVQVVGGISAGLTSKDTREFITKGGLKWCDVMDLHIYDAPRPAESYEEPFRALESLMKARGEQRPVWITEWGCYADDDPPNWPQSIGDPTMNRCGWRGERAATEHIVKFTAVGWAHGLRRIFFHAGTAGRINGPDAGGVLFEYGGAPRTMYAGVAVLTKLMSAASSPIRIINRVGLHGYVFATTDRKDGNRPALAVVWSSLEQSRRLTPAPGVKTLDMMGSRIAGATIELAETPIYLIADDPEPVLRTLAEGR
ncbi:MAG: hypothetical protein ACP5XB_04495 [Isosphaeraceae bacterium]